MAIADDLLSSVSQLPQLNRRTDSNPDEPTLAEVWDELPELWRSLLEAWLGKEGSDDRMMQEFGLGGQRAIRIQNDVMRKLAIATVAEGQELVQTIESGHEKEARKAKRAHKKEEAEAHKGDDSNV